MMLLGAILTAGGFYFSREGDMKRNLTVLATLMTVGLVGGTATISYLFPGHHWEYIRVLGLEAMYSSDIVAMALLLISSYAIRSKTVLTVMILGVMIRIGGIYILGSNNSWGWFGVIINVGLIYVLAKGGYEILNEAMQGAHYEIKKPIFHSFIPDKYEGIITFVWIMSWLMFDAVPLAKSITSTFFISALANCFANAIIACELYIGAKLKEKFHFLSYGLGSLLFFSATKMLLEEVLHLPAPVHVPHSVEAMIHVAVPWLELGGFAAIGLSIVASIFQNQLAGNNHAGAHVATAATRKPKK